MLEQLGRDKPGIALAAYDLDELEEQRMSWGVFRDRRPDCYRRISEPAPVELPAAALHPAEKKAEAYLL